MLPIAYAAVDGMSPVEQSRRSRTKPSWLLLSISDMEDKIQAVNGEAKPDTFAERAEFYYRKRPQLLALLQNFYNRYLYLADRYTRTLSKHQQHHQHQHQLCHDHEHEQDEEDKHVVLDDNNVSDEYLEDALCSEKPDTYDLVLSELVIKFVEYEIVVDELETSDMIQEEAKKKMELQKSLLDVLESERVVLTNENSRLALECLFMKRKAGELASCVLLGKREDHRVFVLGRKIDDLQGQIYELERRNKEYYEKLVKQEQEDEKKSSGINIKIKRLVMKSSASSSSISWSGGEEETSGCSMSSTSYGSCSTGTNLAQVMKEKKPGRGRGHGHGRGEDGEGRKISGWWDRIRKFDVFMCGPHLDSTCC